MEYMIKLLVKLDEKAQELVQDAKSKAESGISKLKNDKLELAEVYKKRVGDELDKYVSNIRSEAESEIQHTKRMCAENISFLDRFRTEQGQKIAIEIAKKCTGE